MKTIEKSYSKESFERWGDTSAYREHEKKTKNYTKEKWAVATGLEKVRFHSNPK